MGFEIKRSVYCKEVVVDTKEGSLFLGVDSKNSKHPWANVTSRSSEGGVTNISVPLSVFADMYEECLTKHTYHCEDLCEAITIERKVSEGFWVIQQDYDVSSLVGWESVRAHTSTVEHRDMLKLLQFCSKEVQVYNTRKLNRSGFSKVKKSLLKLFKLPTSFLNKLG